MISSAPACLVLAAFGVAFFAPSIARADPPSPRFPVDESHPTDPLAPDAEQQAEEEQLQESLPPANQSQANPPPRKKHAPNQSRMPHAKSDTDAATPNFVPAPVDTSKQPSPPIRTIPLAIVPHSRAGKPIAWDPEWRRADWADLTVAASGGALVLASAIVKPLNFARPWQGGILFDDSVRNSLRLKSLDAQGVARDTSDVLLSVETTGPFLVDALTTAWWYRGSRDVAQQIVIIDLETLAVASAIQGVVSNVTSRERPYVSTCGGQLPNNSIDCESFSRDRSFFSGHTTVSFTSASLVCMHHLNLDLFEDGPEDELACGGAFLAAGATGMLRIMGDEHYASDVITGALVGTTVGLGLPWLLHYRRRHADSTGKKGDFSFQILPSPKGLAAGGTF